VDLRKHPEAYRIGRGEQGVFHAEPYKSELLPLWTFKTEEVARGSAEAIYERFLGYRDEEDFVGMDVARKFLQMGYTRSRRYAKYVGGKKSRPREELDAEKLMQRSSGPPRSSTRSGAPPPRTRSTSGSRKGTDTETTRVPERLQGRRKNRPPRRTRYEIPSWRRF
jgi:hypothetical protein